MTKPLWIFGYGSLIWRADFPYLEHKPAYITHWTRRFWQGSTDHRGIPGKPGRVVTLIAQTDERCWGRAYRIAEQDRTSVLEHLDYREKGGYERLTLKIELLDEDLQNSASVTGVTYHATADNQNYLGEASSEQIAAQIFNCHGPSGSNAEYLLKLQASLQQINADDAHIDKIVEYFSVLKND